MSEDQLGSLIYLVLLGLLIGSYVLVANRHQLGRMTRQAVLWGLLFLGVAVGAGLWQDIRQNSALTQISDANGDTIELRRGRDGHFHLTMAVNGTPLRFLVDTGATDLVLTVQDAQRAGIDPDSLRFMGRAQTANGTVETARVWLDTVELAGVTETRVPAQVSAGAMPGSLLGMRYLSRFAAITITGDRLTLTR